MCFILFHIFISNAIIWWLKERGPCRRTVTSPWSLISTRIHRPTSFPFFSLSATLFVPRRSRARLQFMNNRLSPCSVLIGSRAGASRALAFDTCNSTWAGIVFQKLAGGSHRILYEYTLWSAFSFYFLHSFGLLIILSRSFWRCWKYVAYAMLKNQLLKSQTSSFSIDFSLHKYPINGRFSKENYLLARLLQNDICEYLVGQNSKINWENGVWNILGSGLRGSLVE